MVADEDESEPAPKNPAAAPDQQARRGESRERLLRAVDSARLNTLQQRVAWLLNRYPDARDSDRALYRRYWSTFESEHLQGDHVRLDRLTDLAHPANLTRARQKIQNEYRLFLASPEVRERRGTLSEEEKEKALAQRPTFPIYSAYADESGKNEDFLVVGAIWFLQGPELIDIVRGVERLAKETGFGTELHFKKISETTLPFYIAVADLVLDLAPTVAFTSVSIDRRGHKNTDEVLRQLYYHLMVRSIEYHDTSGRAPLPRSFSMIKDAENVGPDAMLLTDLEDRLRQASKSLLGDRLHIDRLGALPSKGSIPLQLGDLYTSSVGRVLNQRTAGETPRDKFAGYLLGKLGTPGGPMSRESAGGLTVHVAL